MTTTFSLPESWREQWAQELAEPLNESAAGDSFSALVFRLGAEWFSVASTSVVEISPVPAIHRIPHRRAGVVNVRGRVAVCVNLGDFLSPLGERDPTHSRLVVLKHGEWIFASVVDALDGVHRVPAADLAPLPPPSATDRFTLDLWTLAGRSVARLDEPRLFTAIKEGLA